MTNEELTKATDLALVRQMRNINDTLDADVGEQIKDEEHATVRRLLRGWEQRLQESLSIRKQRKDAGQMELKS
jgi:hypothetical protein